jgi:heme-degrading monooxygenase HmoA
LKFRDVWRPSKPLHIALGSLPSGQAGKLTLLKISTPLDTTNRNWSEKLNLAVIVYIPARKIRRRVIEEISAPSRQKLRRRNTRKQCSTLIAIDSFHGDDKTAIERRPIDMHMLVRHKVADFAKWKPVYDDHLSARQKAGLKEVHLLRNIENPNEVILLFSVEDHDKAKAFAASDDLRQAMQRAGVSDKPDVYFLE